MAAVVRGLSRRAMAGPRLASVSAKVAARTSNPQPLMIPSRTFAVAPPKMISRYVLQYKYTPDVLEKRDPYRAGHLELIKEMAAEGHVMSAGAFADPVDGALFIFTSREKAEQFKELDPYGPHVVASSTVREWTTVELAETLYRASQRV